MIKVGRPSGSILILAFFAAASISAARAADLPIAGPNRVSAVKSGAADSANGIFEAQAGTKRVFFGPADAPYLEHGYIERINNVIGSFTYAGEITQLGPTTDEIYRSLMFDGPIAGMPLSKSGLAFVSASRDRLVTKDRTFTPGYAQFRNLQSQLRAISQTDGIPEREIALAYIALFAEGEAFPNLLAEHVLRLLESDPKARIVRRLRERLRSAHLSPPFSYFPRPDDLDIATNWRPLRLTNPVNNRIIGGEFTLVDVVTHQADRLLEGLVILNSPNERRLLLPQQLLFARSMEVGSQFPAKTNDALTIRVSQDQFGFYESNFMKGRSGIFLLAVDLREAVR